MRGYLWYFKRGRIEVDGDCWIWLGGQYPDGYGKIISDLGVSTRAQRYFYELYCGPAPRLDVGHSCHRRLCVRLKHLRAVSHVANMREMYAYDLGEAERSEVKRMMLEGWDHSYIAEKLRAPRLVVMRAIKTLDWRQDDLFS